MRGSACCVGRRIALWVCIGFLLLAAAATMVQLDATPAIDWDEGWTFDMARNWVERDFYGRELNGRPAPPGLEASFPVVSTVALAYKILGVGVWQGRVPAAVTMVSAMALFFWLARRLWNTQVAVATLVLVVLLGPHPRANAWWMARQMFAEPLMILAILGGFAGLLLARSHSQWFLVLAILSWGTALFAKTQAQPFVALTLASMVFLNLLNYRRAEAFRMLGVAAGAIVVWRLWGLVHQWSIAGHTLPIESLPEAFTVFGFVLSPEIRITALLFALLVGTLTIFGLVYYIYARIHHKQFLTLQDEADDIRIGLWVFAAAWLAWFIGAAHAGIPRYIFPAIFFGAPFAAVMLSRLTAGFDLRETLQRMSAPLRTRRFTRQNAGAWLAFVLVLFYLPLTLSIGWGVWNTSEGRQVADVTDYLNQQTDADALIETYESPLFLSLARKYHFPPDALHLELNKRAARLPAGIDYDPLEANPDYLVVGPTGRTWKLYEPAIAAGAFQLLEQFGQYDIYVRVR